MDLNSLPFVPCNHRQTRSQHPDLIVIHTNEGPPGANTAEGLASYLQHVDPGYNVVLDENSAIMTARLIETVWGAGGVNARAVHFCITGRAAQSGADWAAPSEYAAVGILADLVRQASDQLGIPHVRITDSRPGNRGICGHADVSRYYPASMGHTDPGPNFPWDRIIGAAPTPKPGPGNLEDMTEFTYRNPTNGNIYLVSGAQQMHLSPGQHDLYAFAAGKEGRKIVDLGDLTAAQLKDIERTPLVGPA